MDQKLFSTHDCCRLLKLAEHRLAYAYRCEKLPEPKHHVGGKRIYTPSDLRRVAEYFGIKMPTLTE